MELCQERNLLDYINSGEIDEITMKKWFGQIAKGLFFLNEELGIAHNDLKIDNILIDMDGNAIISDFGYSDFNS